MALNNCILGNPSGRNVNSMCALFELKENALVLYSCEEKKKRTRELCVYCRSGNLSWLK